MSMLSLFEVLVLCLAQEFDARRDNYMPRELAHERLKQLTGQDFGFNVDEWRTWLAAQGLIRVEQPIEK